MAVSEHPSPSLEVRRWPKCPFIVLTEAIHAPRERLTFFREIVGLLSGFDVWGLDRTDSVFMLYSLTCFAYSFCCSNVCICGEKRRRVSESPLILSAALVLWRWAAQEGDPGSSELVNVSRENLLCESSRTRSVLLTEAKFYSASSLLHLPNLFSFLLPTLN